jgi:hypothetical protein
MARRPGDPGAESVFMSESDRKRTLEIFLAKFGKKVPAFIEKLTAGLLTMRPGGVADLHRMYAESIARGLLSILSKKNNHFVESDISHGYFFLYYFMGALNAAEAKERNVLIGRLKDALNINRRFCDFFWELAVAYSYRSHGSPVVFIEQATQPNVKIPEMVVKSAVGDMHIECKCVSMDSRFPLPENVHVEVAALINTHVVSSDVPNEFIMLAKYKGARDTPSAEIIRDLEVALKNLDKETWAVSSSLWQLELDIRHPHLTDDVYKLLARPESEWPSVLQGIALAPIDKHRLLVISSTRPSALPRTIGDRVSTAIRQLPKSGLRMICIQIPGLHPATQEEFSAFCGWALSDSRTQNLAKSQISLRNGFLGIFVATDFIFEEREGSTFINYYQGGIGTTNSDDARKYFVGIQNWSEQKFTDYFSSLKRVFN